MQINKINILHIADYMLKYSSEINMVSVNDIADYLYSRITYIEEMKNDAPDYSFDEEEFEDYYKFTPVHSPVYEKEQKSLVVQIRRKLGEWLDKKILGDFCISSCLPYEDAVDENNTLKFKSNYKVLYIKRPLNEASINILRNAIETFTYSDASTTGRIIDKLNRLTPVYNRRKFNASLPCVQRRPNTDYYKNLETITDAFRKVIADRDDINCNNVSFEITSSEENKMNRNDYENSRKKQINKISFVYCEYDENKKLIEKPLKNGALTRTVNPVRIMWSNGYYYLVTAIRHKHNNHGDNDFIYINYRIDRMKNVRVIEDKFADVPLLFDAEDYREKNPVMYAQTPLKRIEILCDRSLINNALDTFGFGIDISVTPKPDIVKITIRNSSYKGVKMWALEYCDKCEILAPQSLRDEMKKSAEHLVSVYSRNI